MGTPVQVSQKPRQPCNPRVRIEVANCAQEMLGTSYSIKNYSKEGPNGCPPVLSSERARLQGLAAASAGPGPSIVERRPNYKRVCVATYR